MSNFYAATTGLASNTGAIDSPWDLETALLESLSPGDTLILRDGIYYGRYACNLEGSDGNPITITHYPGESAAIDGYFTTTLQSALTSSSANATIVLASYGTIKQGSVIFVDEEAIYIVDIVGSTYTGVRGWGGTAIVAHSIGAPVWVNGVTMTVNGDDVTFFDIEIYDSNPNRSFSTIGDASGRKGGQGILAYGARPKFINLVIHDTQDGIFLAQTAVNAEVYGLITYNNGHVDPNRGHGHGIYIQNNTGTKTFRNIKSFNNFATGMKGYGQENYANNLLFENVVSFNNGSPSAFPGNPAGYASDHRFSGIYVGTGEFPVNNITITDNYLYQPEGSNTELGNMSVGWTAVGNTDINVTGNYIMGGDAVFALNECLDGICTGNYLYGNLRLAQLGPDDNAVGFTWDNNTYYDLTPEISGVAYSFSYNSKTNRFGGGVLTYDDVGNATGKGWKQWTNFDASSDYVTTAPSGVWIFVLPNEYAIGRATVVAYNWDLASTVPVDLSETGLVEGQAYEIRNVQNFFAAAIATGVYDSGDPIIDVTTAGLTVAMPIGSPDDFTPASTAPEFCVYEILPGAADPDAPGTPTNLQVNATVRRGATGTMVITWDLADSTETSVVLTRVLNGTPTEIVLGEGVESYTNTGLTIGATYTFYVRAVNASGDSENTAPIIRTLTGLSSFGAPPAIAN